MSDKHSDKKQKRSPKPVVKIVLTPEQEAAALAALEARKAEAKLRQENLEKYRRMVPTLSHRQLRGELRRAADSKLIEAGIEGLATAIVSLAILGSLRSFAKMGSHHPKEVANHERGLVFKQIRRLRRRDARKAA